MKVVKARYYEATNEIIPLDPQPIRVGGRWNHERTGTDERGEFVVIDFISEESVYFDYDAVSPIESKELKVTTEAEWLKPAILDTVNTDLLLSESVPTVDVNISEKLVTTNTEMNQAISLTVIEKLTKTIKQLFLSALDVVTSTFRK